MDFYTADLCLLLSDDDDNFNKYNQKIVTDYSFNLYQIITKAENILSHLMVYFMMTRQKARYKRKLYHKIVCACLKKAFIIQWQPKIQEEHSHSELHKFSS